MYSVNSHHFTLINNSIKQAWTNLGMWNHGPSWDHGEGHPMSHQGFFHGSWFIGSFTYDYSGKGYEITSKHGTKYKGRTVNAVVSEFITAYDNATSKGQPA